MAELTIYADFGDSAYAVTKPIKQYDEGVELVISSTIELPEFYQVHFANTRFSDDSIARLATDNTVIIPTDVTQSGETAYAWVYLTDVSSAVTRLEIEIPVRKRGVLPDGTITPTDRTLIEEAIEALNTAVDKTSQDVSDADQSAADAQEFAQNASNSADRAENALQELQNISFDIDSDGCIV